MTLYLCGIQNNNCIQRNEYILGIKYLESEDYSTQGGFINSPSPTFQTHAPSALILPLSSSLKVNIKMLTSFILKWAPKHT